MLPSGTVSRIRGHRLVALASGLALPLIVAGVARAQDPTPSPAPSPRPAISQVLIETNTRLGEWLVLAGLVMLITVFIALSLAALVKFLASLRAQTPLAPAGGGLAGVIGEILRAVPELIKTPAGIGALLLIVGVVLLLGTAATETAQLADFGDVGAGSTPAAEPPSPAPPSPAPPSPGPS